VRIPESSESTVLQFIALQFSYMENGVLSDEDDSDGNTLPVSSAMSPKPFNRVVQSSHLSHTYFLLNRFLLPNQNK
jgi:hypothetical protein